MEKEKDKPIECIRCGKKEMILSDYGTKAILECSACGESLVFKTFDEIHKINEELRKSVGFGNERLNMLRWKRDYHIEKIKKAQRNSIFGDPMFDILRAKHQFAVDELEFEIEAIEKQDV